MSKEIPLQRAMFSDELVDTRSDYRKRQDRRRTKPRQIEMFSTQETVQIGVTCRPWLKDLPPPALALDIQDVRTEEEKERDWWREVHKQMAPLFDGHAEAHDHDPDANGRSEQTAAVKGTTVYEAPYLRPIGFRAYARSRSIAVRSHRAGPPGR